MKNTLLTSALALALVGASGTAAAQYYPQQPNMQEIIIQQILNNVIGSRYGTDTRYRTPQEQEIFRAADTNRDGVLSQYEVEAYRARMGYGRYDDRYNDRYNDTRHYGREPRFPVRTLDTNRDGYISRSEFRQFMRMLDRQGYDYFYEDTNTWRR